MNATLKKALDKAEQLSPREQGNLATLIVDYTQSVVDGDQFEHDLADPEYKAYVTEALENGAADIKAGKIMTSKTLLARSKSRLDKLHG